MESFRVNKGDGEDIGFSTICLISGVITFTEFKDWIYYIIDKSNDVPSYFYEILDTNKKSEYILGAGEVIGFYPDWDATADELNALDGIGYKRFADFQSDASSKQSAATALIRNPHVENRFKATFPFIKI